MTQQMNEKEAEKERLKARSAAMEAKEKELNASRTGKGTRIMLGMTRGRNPVEIQYEAFDLSQPATLPESVAEFTELTKTTDPKVFLGYIIDGYNEAQASAASDPISEFVDPTWDDKLKTAFRTTVRNYSMGAGVSIEDAVALIKPGIVASQAKAKETQA